MIQRQKKKKKHLHKEVGICHKLKDGNLHKDDVFLVICNRSTE